MDGERDAKSASPRTSLYESERREEFPCADGERDVGPLWRLHGHYAVPGLRSIAPEGLIEAAHATPSVRERPPEQGLPLRCQAFYARCVCFCPLCIARCRRGPAFAIFYARFVFSCHPKIPPHPSDKYGIWV